jgi:hypothetical protein
MPYVKSPALLPRSLSRRSRDDDPRIVAPPAGPRICLGSAHPATFKSTVQVEEGSLYPALQRLLKAKLVKAEWTTSSSTNRGVRVYEITRAGLRHLDREISSFDRMLEGVDLVLGLGRRTASF